MVGVTSFCKNLRKAASRKQELRKTVKTITKFQFIMENRGIMLTESCDRGILLYCERVVKEERKSAAVKEEMRKARKGKIALILCNILLVIIGVVFVMHYSANVTATQKQMAHESFCNTVETMKQISERYLETERRGAEDWAAYIEHEHMTMDEALDYIRSSTVQSDRIAHFVDMETFAARSSNLRADGDSIEIYQRYSSGIDARYPRYIAIMQQMFNRENGILGKYRVVESQIDVLSVGTRVTLREGNGEKDYLLLRVIPVESMKKLWLFPMAYADAEIGLVNYMGDYVIPAYAMRSENFVEFIRSYNFQDDFNGADIVTQYLRNEESSMMVFQDSRGRACYWYFSRLSTYSDLDIVGYIPTASLDTQTNNTPLVSIVASIFLAILLIDGIYILGINRRLRTTAKLAQQASDAKTQFLSSMSHDIRTPLNAVLGMTELAQAHLSNTEYVRECLRKISVSGNHLLTLINDILEISRVESGRIQVNPAPFEVTELTAGLVSITRSQTIGRGLEFDVQQNNITHDCLMGDKLRLSQVYLNLLNNAVKYTNPGGKVRLEMREECITPESVTLVCVVEDTGIGMSEEFQKTMYESFTRAVDTRIDKTQGTGLGLAIVKRMVLLMNGTIDCKSVEGVGTTFTVRIPLDVAQMPEVAQKQLADEMQGADLAGLHVMIAEDNDINWEIIDTMLEGCGILCERAETGRICVDKLLAAPPDTYDLVLMDVQMPVLNGRDATHELRACNRPDLRAIPIAAMTADAFAEDVQACIDAGMDAHISKPIELDKVLMTMRKLLSRKSHDSLYK